MHKQVRLATNLGRGGVSALILTGSVTEINQADFTLSTVRDRGRSLGNGELLFGIVNDNETGSIIDEIVIAAISENSRIITGHGGSASALALLDFYISLGFEEYDDNKTVTEDTLTHLKTLLAETKTEHQAYSCVRAINELKSGSNPDIAGIIELLRPRVVVLAGAPNVGKSSLLNMLCGFERVLVSDIAGTTRDAVRDYIDIGGYYTHIIDTAGFRAEASETETEAIKRGKAILATADVILLVLDSSKEMDSSDKLAIETVQKVKSADIIPVLNKIDINNNISFDIESPVEVSCTENTGITDLLTRITASLSNPTTVGN